MRLVSTLSLVAAIGLLTAPADAQVSVGEKPTYSFRTAPVNGMGIKSLEDLRGKPVLVEFWGTR